MKIKLLLLFLVPFISFAQEKVFMYKGNPINDSLLSVRIENTNRILKYTDFEQLKSPSSVYFWIRYQSKDSLLLNYNRYIKTKTFYFESNIQSFEETVITADVLRKESADTMHVVDFHFVNGELYTIQKSVNSLERKYLSHDKVYTLVNSKATLLYTDLMGSPLIQIKDSIYTYADEKIEFIMLEHEYQKKIFGYIGTYKDKSYFKNTYFYNLIDEVSAYDTKEELETFIDVFYDSSSLNYVSQHYLNLNPVRGLPVYLFYSYKHKNAGKKYHNDKNTSIANLNVNTAQVFKSLQGSNGFLGFINILEESRMDAYLLDSMLITFDFNRSEMNYYLNGINIKNSKLELQKLWYRNEFYTDDLKKKGYFLFLKNNRKVIIEIDYLSGTTNEVPLLSGIHRLYHWEVNDGRLYILKRKEITHWKRTLYSYNINDIRIK